MGLDQVVLAQGVGALQHVFQFAHVAGEAIVLQLLQGIRADPRGGQAAVAGKAPEHALGQQRDVLAALAQRRNPQLDDVQPVVQVLAEAPGGDFGGQVLVRRAEDAHVHRHFLLAAHRAHGLFLDGAQQLDLHRQG
ncbi:hypothetical protein D9M71_148030 [compost metagenome]